MFKNLAFIQNPSIFVHNKRLNAHIITKNLIHPLLKLGYHGQFYTQ